MILKLINYTSSNFRVRSKWSPIVTIKFSGPSKVVINSHKQVFFCLWLLQTASVLFFIKTQNQTSAQVNEIVHREATDPIQMESDRISNQLKRVELLRNIREQKPRTPPPKEPEERITEVEFDFDEGIINILKKYGKARVNNFLSHTLHQSWKSRFKQQLSGDSFAAARLLAAQRKNLIAPEFDGLWNQGENQDFDPEDDAAMEKVSVQTNRIG